VFTVSKTLSKFLIRTIPSMFLVVAVLLLLQSREMIHGNDFLFYILFSRDIAGGMTDVPEIRFFYFPGMYLFWSYAIRFLGSELRTIQWVYVSVILLNLSLVGAITVAILRNWQWAILAAAFYLLLGFRTEILTGNVEPIATLPYLFGLFLFSLFFRRRHFGLAFVLLGIGLGLSAFVKQQAGLLALGSLAFVFFLRPVSRAEKKGYSLLELALLPAVAMITFGGAFVFEGGLSALKQGLFSVGRYPSQGSWVGNLRALLAFYPAFPVAYVFGAIICFYSRIASRRSKNLTQSLSQVVIYFCFFSASACLLQFTKRAYPHYGLLALPALSILIATGTAYALRQYTGVWKYPRIRRFILAVSVILLAVLIWNGSKVYRRTLQFTSLLVRPIPWRSSSVIQPEFLPICKYLTPGEDLYILLPPGNSIHWNCGTRSLSWGYGYGWRQNYTQDELIAPLYSRKLSSIFVTLPEYYGATERAIRVQGDVQLVLKKAQELGFRPMVSSKVGTLYRRSGGT
jgi:hypothetical protein